MVFFFFFLKYICVLFFKLAPIRSSLMMNKVINVSLCVPRVKAFIFCLFYFRLILFYLFNL